MSVMDELITDRTAEDVERIRELRNKILTEGLNALTLEERAEYLSDTNKGAYNVSDLNRVASAGDYILTAMDSFYTQYMNSLSIQKMGGDPIYEPYFDPNDLPYVFPTFSGLTYLPLASITGLLGGLTLVRETAVHPDTLPFVPTVTQFSRADYSTANDIERLLHSAWEDFQEYTVYMYDLANRAYVTIPYSDEFFAGEY